MSTTIGNFQQPPMQDPNTYLRIYAQQNGLSESEAKAELQSKYGDPMQGGMGGASVFGNPAARQSSEDEYLDFSPFGGNNYSNDSWYNFNNYDYEEQFNNANGADSQGNFFQRILNFFKGNQGPQKEGDPQYNNDSTYGNEGPQKEGDPQPHLDSTYGNQGPQKEGDPQPHLESSYGNQGPQKEGDPQPHLRMPGINGTSSSSNSGERTSSTTAAINKEKTLEEQMEEYIKSLEFSNDGIYIV